MEEIIRGALFQDNNFECIDFNRFKIEKLIIVHKAQLKPYQ